MHPQSIDLFEGKRPMQHDSTKSKKVKSSLSVQRFRVWEGGYCRC